MLICFCSKFYLLTGVSFPFGGSGYDPLISELVGVNREDKGSSWRNQNGKHNIKEHIHNVHIGSDYIANTYSQTPIRLAHYGIPSYTDLMVFQASNFLQELYGLGARRIGVIGLPPIGCVPSQRTIGGGIQRACSDSENQAAILFNTKLLSQMDALKEPNSKVITI